MCTHVYQEFYSLFPTSRFPARHWHDKRHILGRILVLEQKTPLLVPIFFPSSNTFQCSFLYFETGLLKLSTTRSTRLLYMDGVELDQPGWAHQRLLWRSKSNLLSSPKRIL
jgi:hypothetical protein